MIEGYRKISCIELSELSVQDFKSGVFRLSSLIELVRLYNLVSVQKCHCKHFNQT